MTVTTSFGWTFAEDLLLMNNLSTAGDQRAPNAAANFARTEYFGVWEDPNAGTDAEGRIIKADTTPVTNEFHVSPSATTLGDSTPMSRV